ncbi:MAG: hypothetical protein HY700_18475 [Gemmatimonadetes bacterium]|nr:hypothetical protein [Gemmatimonadota bacterium]
MIGAQLHRLTRASAAVAVLAVPLHGEVPHRAGEEPLSPAEAQALARLDRQYATTFRLMDSWFENRRVQYYDFGPSDPQPGSLYRVRKGGDILSSIPGIPGYSSLRQVFDVEILPAAGMPPDSVRSHLIVLQLVRQGRARLIATGIMLNAPIIPAGSDLERDPDNRTAVAAFYRGRPIYYFDFGPSRAGLTPVISTVSEFPARGEASPAVGTSAGLSAIPGLPGYHDLWDVEAAIGTAASPRSYRQALADIRSGKLRSRRAGWVINRPVIYVDGRPATRPTRPIGSPRNPIEEAWVATTPGMAQAPKPALSERPLVRPVTLPEGSGTVVTVETPPRTGSAMAYAGTAGQTSVSPPRLAGNVVIDGVLDEDVWRSAPVLTGFHQFRPIEGRPAEDSTEARIWYSATAIYIGIRAYAPAGTVRASLADRDKIEKEDYVQVLLDTFNDRRQALAFGVNALGVQADGIKAEGGQQPRAGGPGGQPGQGGQSNQSGNQEGFERNLDLSPDFVWESKGHLTPFGYEVEMRIPFKSLRYQSRQVQDWGINVLRKVQRSGFEDTWTRTQRAASFLAQSGALRGLHDLQRGLVLDLNPFTLGRIDSDTITTPPSPWSYSAKPELGANVRWGATPNLTISGAVNPDFSQVEADAAQAPPDPRFAQFFQEKRPFFVEGIEQFNTPGQLVYTRRVTDPLGALKLTGKLGSTAIGVLSAVDSKGASSSGTEYPLYNIVRLRRDVGPTSTAGLVYTDKVDGRDFNRVAVADARILFGRVYSLTLQGGGSITRTTDTTSSGALWDIWADRSGRYLGFTYRFQGFGPDLQAQSGFIRRTGVVLGNLSNRVTYIGRRGAFLESWTGRVTYNGTWNYGEFFDRRQPVENRWGFSNQFNFKGGWTLTLNPLFEIFKFDPVFHEDYFVERAAGDTIPYVITEVRRNYDAITRLETPQFSWGSFNVSFTWSPHDVDIYEFASAGLMNLVAAVDLKPTNKLRINAQYTRRYLTRLRDRTHVVTTDIPRLKLEYQIARPLFIRFVGQYDARVRDALRDARTDAPLLIRDDNGLLAPSTRTVTNDFRFDALLSFQPSPGTVLFAGYGSSLTETDAFTFRDVQRLRDWVFVKLSYLFRVK